MSKNVPSQYDHFTIKGHWWLPSSGKRVAGDLRYTEGDLTLSLYGGLSDATAESPFSATPDESEYSLIYGESEDNVPITVLKPFYTKWKPDITTLAIRPGQRVGLRSSQLHCRFILEGVHLSSEADAFSKCRVEVPSLDVWLGISPFNIDMKDSFRSMSLDYVLPENQQFEIERSACRVNFIHAVTPPGLPLGSSPAISHHTYIEIEPSWPQPLKHLLDCSSEVVDLLSVVYGGPVLSKRTMLCRPSHNEPISTFYPRHEVTCKSYDTHDFLIRYEEIKEWFSALLDNWMNSTGNLKRARRMLISSERRPSAFSNLGISVAREWRGRGVGTALVVSLLEWATEIADIEKVSLDVFATNLGAIGLYKKLGFVEEGRRIKDIKRGADHYVDTVMMYQFVK